MRKENIVSRAAAAATALVLLGGVVFTSCQQPTTTEPETAKHTVTFDSKGGTEIAPVTVEDGKTATEPADKPTKDGYDFGGWYSGEAAYDFSTVVTADLTLTAKWTAKTFTINYVLNGGSNSADNPATYTIETEDITLKDPTGPADKPNFGGWFKEADFKTQVTKIANRSIGDLTLYAYFSEKAVVKHSVKVMCGETEAYSGEVLDGAALSEDDVKKAAAEKIPEGCELEGFYSDAAFTTKFDFSKGITADTVIYVKVKAVQKFTVTFDADNGTEATSATVKSGDKVAKPADPTKDGYTFKGWFNGDAAYNFDAPVTGEITLKAKWGAKATVLTSMTAVKNEDGTFSLPDGTYQTALDSSNPILIVTMPESVSMKTGDSVKLTGTVTFDDKTVYKQFYLQTHDKAATPIFGWNMVAEWSDTGLKGLKKDLSVTQKIESDYSFDTCKFVLAGPLTEGDTTCPTFTLKDVKVTYIPYVAGADYTIFEAAQTESGNVEFSIGADKFTEYLKDYNTIIFTLKNGAEAARDGWGVLALISQETSGTWAWHNLANNTELGTDSYGQLSLSSFASGAEGTVEVDLQKLADAVKAEGATNQLALQTSNGALLLKISLIKR